MPALGRSPVRLRVTRDGAETAEYSLITLCEKEEPTMTM